MVQTIEQKQNVIKAWMVSEYFPRNPLLLSTPHNAAVIDRELDTIPVLSVPVVAAAVDRLRQQGKLEYADYVEPVAPVFVLTNPDTKQFISTRDELNAFVNADSKNMRRLLYPNGKKSVEAETEVNRLLTMKATPDAAKAAARQQKEAADKWGIKRRGSDDTELSKPTKPKFYEDTVGNANRAAAEQERARMSIDRLIQNFTVVSPSGRVDHGKTSEVRQQLRAIKFRLLDGQPDYVAMENAVGQAIRKY